MKVIYRLSFLFFIEITMFVNSSDAYFCFDIDNIDSGKGFFYMEVESK